MIRKPEKKITIMSIPILPDNVNVNDKLQWFAQSFGLFGIRDKDRSCYRIFVELIKNIKNEKGVSTDYLAYKLNLTRSTVIHHLNKLEEAGFISNFKSKYRIKTENLKSLVKQIRRDINKILDDIDEISEQLDKDLRL